MPEASIRSIPYCGAAPGPEAWLEQWNLDPVLLLVLAIAAVWGGVSLRRDRRQWFLGGVAVLFVLFVSPLCALTSALFSARAVHHALIVAVAAPMLVWALPVRPVTALRPLYWTLVHAGVFWAWHVPSLYSAALSSDAVYWLMQLSLLGTGLGFWHAIRHVPVITAVAALLGTMVQMGLLGALLTFANAPLYSPHLTTTQVWGLSPLEDQQLAGLIMWAPAAALYLVAALLLVSRWLRNEAAPATP